MFFLWDSYYFFVTLVLLGFVLVPLIISVIFLVIRDLLNPNRPLKIKSQNILSNKASDETARIALIEKIRQQGLPTPTGPLPIVSLEDFFEGNEDYGSIGCNVNVHPGPQAFFCHLLAIRSRPDVQDILVEINEVEEGDPTMWPFSESIILLTSASIQDVSEWMKPLMPDEIIETNTFGRPPALPTLDQGMQVYAAWWD